MTCSEKWRERIFNQKTEVYSLNYNLLYIFKFCDGSFFNLKMNEGIKQIHMKIYPYPMEMKTSLKEPEWQPHIP